MTNLHYALIAFGVALVAIVVIYNTVQERRARGKAEKAFGERPPDALFDEPAARREPTFGPTAASPAAVPPARVPALDETVPPRFAAEDLDASGAPAAQGSSRIDTVAGILPDHPAVNEQV